MSGAAWRFLLSAPMDGPTNMAVDEAILTAVASGASPPTVRVYCWEPPCLSLGYFQPLEEANLDECARRGVPVVRRATGGSAILHADELTYSVSVLENDPHVRGDVLTSYGAIASVLVQALARLGVAAALAPVSGVPIGGKRPAPCFLRPAGHEIVAKGRKLVGSAQVRRNGALLQHGAMPLDGDPGEICGLLAMAAETRKAAAERLRTGAITLAEAAGREVTFAEAADAVRDAFVETWGIRLAPGELSVSEWAAVGELSRDRYRDLTRDR